ncbi:23970_t:CDS:1, partial [Dentiscutata erythropus]
MSEALEEEYSDYEKMQRSIKLDITVNYWLKQLEYAKKWVIIEK